MTYIIVRFTLFFLLAALALFAGHIFLSLYKKYLRINRDLNKESKDEKATVGTKYSDIK